MGIEYSMFLKHRCFFKNIDDKIIDGRVSDASITSMFYIKTSEKYHFALRLDFLFNFLKLTLGGLHLTLVRQKEVYLQLLGRYLQVR